MKSEEFDPRAILVEFAESLPDTVRDVVLARCNLAFGQFDRMKPDSNEDQREIFRSLFTAASAVERGYEVAKICGAMDLAVEPDEYHEEFTKNLAEKFPELESFQKMALQAPMKSRHLEQAHARFAELRSTLLAPPTIHLWMLYHMAKDRLG